jgi:hypothetical protein
VKYLESTLGSPDGVDHTRIKLATYTASHAAYGDLIKMMRVLRARDTLAKFSDALPATFDKFDGVEVFKLTEALDQLGKTHADEIPFALTLVARRLKPYWQLIRLATQTAPSKNAADIAATPYAIAISMVLDRLDDNRAALQVALKNERVLVAKEILTEAYDTEKAVRVRIDLLDGSDWGKRLRDLMDAIAALVDAEVSRFPDSVDHVLASSSLRGHQASGGLQALTGRLTNFWRGRGATP